MNEQNNSGWTEYNRMILNQLEIINTNIQTLNNKINEIDNRVLAITLKEDKIKELADWKNSVTSVVSINELHKIKETHDKLKHEDFTQIKNNIEVLKEFKIKAITAFSIIQFIMALLIFWKNLFN